MEATAIILGDTEIQWSSILIVLSILAWFFYAYSLYVANGGKRLAILIGGPLAVVGSYFASRFIYWYCHIEQYASFKEAASLSAGGYAMLGVIPGVFLAAVLMRLVQLNKNLLAMLDALVPPTAMAIGLLYLLPLFDDSCRGKIIFSDPKYFRLPYSSAVLTAQGDTEYRLATFFLSFLVFLLLAFILRIYYLLHTKVYGATTSLFLLLFSSTEFILDSTRYDAGYFQFNGFVSVLQIFAGVAILGLSIFYLVRSLKKNGFRWYHIPLFLLILASMGGCGYLEYLIQRHGNWYVPVYSGMGGCCLLMVLFPYLLCVSGRKKAEKAEASEDSADAEAGDEEEKTDNEDAQAEAEDADSDPAQDDSAPDTEQETPETDTDGAADSDDGGENA